MNKIIKIVIILVCVLSVLLAIFGWMFISFLLSLPDTRGLQVSPVFMRTNDAKFPTVENRGKQTVFFCYFCNENGTIIDMADVDEQFWNGSCYALPVGKYVSLILAGELYYSKEIYVLFYDGINHDYTEKSQYAMCHRVKLAEL
jgi:hypothetical protein